MMQSRQPGIDHWPESLKGKLKKQNPFFFFSILPSIERLPHIVH